MWMMRRQRRMVRAMQRRRQLLVDRGMGILSACAGYVVMCCMYA